MERMKKELETKSAATDSIELRPKKSEWENEGEEELDPTPDLSDKAISISCSNSRFTRTT